MLVGMSMRMKMSLKSKCEDESLSSEQLEISPKSDLPESSSVLGSLQTVSLTKTCQIRTRIKKKKTSTYSKKFLKSCMRVCIPNVCPPTSISYDTAARSSDHSVGVSKVGQNA